jgi:hypothetical protein
MARDSAASGDLKTNDTTVSDVQGGGTGQQVDKIMKNHPLKLLGTLGQHQHQEPEL